MGWVLLRGLGREAGHWGDFVQQLRAAFPGERVITPDLPGCGVHFARRSPATLASLTQSVRDDVERLSPAGGPHWLLGLSLGGMAALHWATRYPQEVAGLVLINSSARALSPWWRRLRPFGLGQLLLASATANVEARESRIFALTSARHEQRALFVARASALADAHPVKIENVARLLWAAASQPEPAKTLPMPALVLVGAGDRLVHPTCSGRLAAHLGAALAVHATAGHELCADDPDWVLAQLARWREGLFETSRNRHLVTKV